MCYTHTNVSDAKGATMNKQELNLVSTNPVEWAADDVRGYFGYSVHVNNCVWPEHVGFPAFTHEQMLECKRITETMGERFGFDSYPHLVFDAASDTWSEVYYDDESDVEDVMEPFFVDGLKLYALGDYSGWAWGLISDGYDYQVA